MNHLPKKKIRWIAHQLDIGRAPVFLLLMSDFKSVASFGFFNFLRIDFLCVSTRGPIQL